MPSLVIGVELQNRSRVLGGVVVACGVLGQCSESPMRTDDGAFNPGTSLDHPVFVEVLGQDWTSIRRCGAEVVAGARRSEHLVEVELHSAEVEADRVAVGDHTAS